MYISAQFKAPEKYLENLVLVWAEVLESSTEEAEECCLFQ